MATEPRAVRAYEEDEFVLDATRVTLYLADSGFNGAEFRDDVLMDQHGIQVNKTSINTVLFIFTIGVTWSSLSALLQALRQIAAYARVAALSVIPYSDTSAMMMASRLSKESWGTTGPIPTHGASSRLRTAT